MSDEQQTRALKLARVEEKRAVKELNKIGKRLEWVREKLELSQRQVCLATDIPFSSYCGREGGVRAELVEEYLVLAQFFNRLWQKRFTEGKPWHDGQEIKKISAEWIMFGHSDLEANAETIIQEYQIKIRELETEFWNNEQEYLRQLDMFKGAI